MFDGKKQREKSELKKVPSRTIEEEAGQVPYQKAGLGMKR